MARERLLDEGERSAAPRRGPEAAFHRRHRGPLHLADRLTTARQRVLNEHEVDAVYHLAAQTIVGTANRSPLATWEANVRGTYTLLEACRGLGGVKRVVVVLDQGLRRPTTSCPTARTSRRSRATRTTCRRRAPT